MRLTHWRRHQSAPWCWTHFGCSRVSKGHWILHFHSRLRKLLFTFFFPATCFPLMVSKEQIAPNLAREVEKENSNRVVFWFFFLPFCIFMLLQWIKASERCNLRQKQQFSTTNMTSPVQHALNWCIYITHSRCCLWKCVSCVRLHATMLFSILSSRKESLSAYQWPRSSLNIIWWDSSDVWKSSAFSCSDIVCNGLNVCRFFFSFFRFPVTVCKLRVGISIKDL